MLSRIRFENYLASSAIRTAAKAATSVPGSMRPLRQVALGQAALVQEALGQEASVQEALYQDGNPVSESSTTSAPAS